MTINVVVRFFLFILLGLLIALPSFSQEKVTISGYAQEEETGESLIGASVYIVDAEGTMVKGAATNAYGFFSISSQATSGTFYLKAQYIGLNDYTKEITLDKDLSVTISLKSNSVVKQEVIVTAQKSNVNVEAVQMGTVEMEMETIKELPAFLGEVDVLKTIQLLPGVQSGGEGNTGFYVRGGGPDQNLILLDEAVIYNAAHLFGFFSVFNGDAVKNIELTKGGMPAQYGGRLASVLDISMKEGNMREHHAEGGIGVISSRLTVQGPIKKDTASYIISARRTYADVLATPFIPDSSDFKGSSYYFYDLNMKMNYRISHKDRLFFSTYFGRDVFEFNNEDAGFGAKIPWGNAMASLRWNHLFNNKLFVNTSLIFSDYQFEFEAGQQDFNIKLFSGIRDWNAKMDFTWLPGTKHNVKFGLNYIFHTFTPSNVSAQAGDFTFDLGDVIRMYAHDAALYISDDWEISDRIKVNGGLRATMFQQIGPFERYIKNELDQIVDTVNYGGVNDPNPILKLLIDGGLNEPVVTYRRIEPRFAMRYKINETASVKASYTHNYQYIHLASLSSLSLPTDIWVPSSTLVQPQKGIQYSVGFFKNFFHDMFESSVELYYKTMENQVEYREGASPGVNIADNPDNNFVFGSGESYGAEFFLKKAKGKVQGWIGYTLSRTTRQFPDINNGKEYFAKYDRRHDLSFILTYKWTERISLSAVFVYATGNSITPPSRRYLWGGQIVTEFAERNTYRLAPYHRADLSATIKSKKNENRKFQSSWNISIYNLYSRANPFFIYLDPEGNFADGSLKFKAYQVSLFPILPSVTWNFKF